MRNWKSEQLISCWMGRQKTRNLYESLSTTQFPWIVYTCVCGTGQSPLSARNENRKSVPRFQFWRVLNKETSRETILHVGPTIILYSVKLSPKNKHTKEVWSSRWQTRLVVNYSEISFVLLDYTKYLNDEFHTRCLDVTVVVDHWIIFIS